MYTRLKLYNRHKIFDDKVISYLGTNLIVNQDYSFQSRYYNEEYKKEFEQHVENATKYAEIFKEKGFALTNIKE